MIDSTDLTGMITHSDVSVDGGVWRLVFPDDGIADSSREKYSLDLPVDGAGEHTISLRSYDDNGNIGSIRLVVRR